MIPWQVRWLEKSNKYKPSALLSKFRNPARWIPTLQWITIGLVGLFLGIYSIFVWSIPTKWALLSIPMILAPFVAMVLGQVRKLLLAVVLLDIPLQLDSYIGHREGAIGGATSGMIVSITTLALIGLYTMWLAELLAKPRKTHTRPPFRQVLPLATYLSIAIVSIIVASDTQLAFFGIFLLGQMFLLYVYLIGTVHTQEDIIFIVMMLLIGLILESLIMIGLRGVGHTIEIGGFLKARIDSGVRVGGTVGGPNTASGYISLLLTPALAFILSTPHRMHKVLAISAFSLGVIALFLTLSRSGWIASTVSIVLFTFLVWRRGWLPIITPIIIIIAGMILAFVFGEEILSRLFGSDDGSANSRIPLMIIAFKMIVENPILGVGINNFTVVLLQYAKLEIIGFWLYTVHNKYLLVWAETGTIGLLAFLWFLLSTLRQGWLCWLLKDRFLALLALGFGTAILGHMIQLNFDTFQNRALVQMLWISAALIVAMYAQGKNNIPMNRKPLKL